MYDKYCDDIFTGLSKKDLDQNPQNMYVSKTAWCVANGVDADQGPVVQSVVSLTSTLRVISITVLADSIYNIMIFFAEKMWVAFAMQKLLTFFQQKFSAYTRITWSKF